ncbi:hypothetical protein [Streptomyces coffeae]|uniref:Secreted protein n=1 Tax=Streptomyces coffeae TaxID=621382 RepID=A0ABS1NEI2_9ACTN|nr:hypothetical protein [Streptomyces coffeae]MBL1098453.1 hypothetical protein [Streptomyces coffeae]
MLSTRGVRGAMVPWAALTLAASTMPAMAAASATESTPSVGSPHASGWSESRVTPGNAPLFASTRPDAQTTWVAGTRFVPKEDNNFQMVPTLWERDERKGSGWKRVKTPPVPGSDDIRYNDVDTSSPRNGLVVGDYAEQLGGVVTQRWNGKAWKSAVAPVPRGTTGAGLTSVDTRAPGDARGAGAAQVPVSGGGSHIVGMLQHWDGTRWKAQKLPDVGAGARDHWQLSSVTALAADDVWAVGGTGFIKPGKPVLLHYDGARWSKVAVPGVGAARAGLNAVVAGPGGQVWAVGQTQAPDGSWQALALRYDGKKWTNVPLPKGTKELASVAISQGAPVVVEWKTEDTSAALRCHAAIQADPLPPDHAVRPAPEAASKRPPLRPCARGKPACLPTTVLALLAVADVRRVQDTQSPCRWSVP